ncbi:hypothetical protein C8R44DRAFT_739637 [Mycena epipterygia]|nr:hypothetical protein C8R44DRAFT_739637 [Mycena epipterygia]
MPANRNSSARARCYLADPYFKKLNIDLASYYLRLMSHTPFSPGSLYLAAFAQAQAPHVGLLIPKSESTGTLVHIRVDRGTSPNWQRQVREQKISGDMFLTSLLRIRDNSVGGITVEQLIASAEKVSVPENDEFGECLPWAMRAVAQLQSDGLLQVDDLSALEKEFREFSEGNRGYARRDKFPNVAISVQDPTRSIVNTEDA